MPEVRRFFYDSVLAGEYGDKLKVKFVPGATPELILYGQDDQEISREAVNNLSFEELHEFVQARGFTKAPPPAPADQEPEEAAEAAELAKQQQQAAAGGQAEL